MVLHIYRFYCNRNSHNSIECVYFSRCARVARLMYVIRFIVPRESRTRNRYLALALLFFVRMIAQFNGKFLPNWQQTSRRRKKQLMSIGQRPPILRNFISRFMLWLAVDSGRSASPFQTLQKTANQRIFPTSPIVLNEVRITRSGGRMLHSTLSGIGIGNTIWYFKVKNRLRRTSSLEKTNKLIFVNC